MTLPRRFAPVLMNIAFVVAVGYVAFLLGAFVVQFKIAPFYGWLVPSLRATLALTEQVQHRSEVFDDSSSWQPARRTETGVTVWDKNRAFNGYTFFTSGHAATALLIDMSGEVVHEWNVPLSAVWPDPRHLGRPVDDATAIMRRGHLLPNGDILAVYVSNRVTPWGCGLARIGAGGDVVWRYSEHVHHDVSVGEDGNLYTLVHAISRNRIADLPEVHPPFVDDFVVVLTDEGHELQRIHLLSAFRRSPYFALLRASMIPSDKGDVLHANSAKYVTRAFAEASGIVKEGQILVSLRNPSMLAAIDRESESVVWASTGPWGWQHDPDLLDNGHLLLFDNLSQVREGRGSRVLEVDPAARKIMWEYTGIDTNQFYSHFWGGQQKLPNGNVLIAESAGGRLFEVAPNGDIVWEWLSPFRREEDREYTGIVLGAARFAMDDTPFLSGLNKARLSKRP